MVSKDKDQEHWVLPPPIKSFSREFIKGFRYLYDKNDLTVDDWGQHLT